MNLFLFTEKDIEMLKDLKSLVEEEVSDIKPCSSTSEIFCSVLTVCCLDVLLCLL